MVIKNNISKGQKLQYSPRLQIFQRPLMKITTNFYYFNVSQVALTSIHFQYFSFLLYFGYNYDLPLFILVILRDYRNIFLQVFQSNSMIYQTAPAWSIHPKAPTSKQTPTPPPDAYKPNPTLTLSKSPAWKLGKQLRNQSSIAKMPGPNSYNPPCVEKSCKYGVFGQQKRLRQIVQATPGPGAYQYPSNKQNFSSLFPHQSKCVDNVNDYPGPGAYEASIARQRRGVKMNRQLRFTTENRRQVSPGPGNYSYQRPNSASISFGRAERITSPHDRDNQTGPGQYTFIDGFQASSTNRKGFTLVGRHTTKPQATSPGPAEYSPKNRDHPTSPSITIVGKYKKREFDRTPSPDQYDPQFKAIITKAESFSIGRADRLTNSAFNAIPGPGAYIKTQHISTGISISLTKSRKHEEGSEVPGPGAYNPKKEAVQRRPASAKMGKSLRFEKMKNQTSPCFYSSTSNLGTNFSKPKFSFPRKRRLQTKAPQNPGPGAYNIPSSVFPK